MDIRIIGEEIHKRITVIGCIHHKKSTKIQYIKSIVTLFDTKKKKNIIKQHSNDSAIDQADPKGSTNLVCQEC